MKKIMAIAFCASLAINASAQETVLKVSGTAPKNVTAVYFSQMSKRAKLDSVVVTNGKFEFSHNYPKGELVYLSEKSSKAKYSKPMSIIADGTPVSVDIATKTVSGSELNNKWSRYNITTDSLMNVFQTKSAELEASLKDQTRKSNAPTAEQKKLFEEMSKDADKILMSYIEENKDNDLPAYIIGTEYYGMDFQTLETLLNPSAAYYNNKMLDKVKSYAEALSKRQPGKMFTDLSMQDLNGKSCKLSDWCGKGNYVMIDFWASWCGPCCAEMPNVVANYKKYHAKGFEVVGVSFDSKAESWKKAVERLGLQWPQISDLKGWKSEGASKYGISGIPSSVLVDGSGKIVALDLRGEMLGEKLKEIYGF